MPAAGIIPPRYTGGAGGFGGFGDTQQQPQVVDIPRGPAPLAPPPTTTPAPAAAPPPPVVARVTAPPLNTGVPGTGAVPGAPQTFAAQTSPDLADALKRVRARLDRPTDTTNEVNQFGQQVAAFANGQMNRAGGNAAQRGVLGISGGADQVNTDTQNVAQGTFAKGAADINLQRARDDDQFLLGSMPAFAEPGRQGLADRSLGIQAAGQAGQLALGGAELDLRGQVANQNAQLQQQQLAQQLGNQNFQQQLAAQQAAQQAQAMMMQFYSNIYR